VSEPPFVRSPSVCAKRRRRGLPRRCRRHRGRFVGAARNKSCSSLRRGEPASSTTCANGAGNSRGHAHIAHMSVTPRTSHRATADLPPHPAVTSIPKLYRSPALDSARERRPCYHPAPTAPNTSSLSCRYSVAHVDGKRLERPPGTRLRTTEKGRTQNETSAHLDHRAWNPRRLWVLVDRQ
jgi:hypothetical protein